MLHARTPFDPHFTSGVELPMAGRSNMTFIHVSKAAGQSVINELEREHRQLRTYQVHNVDTNTPEDVVMSFEEAMSGAADLPTTKRVGPSDPSQC